MKRIATGHVAMDPRRCTACWECVEKCPKGVIGKVGFRWHRHVIFKDADACIGCNKCIKVCPHGVFFRLEEAASIRRKSMGILFRIERMLPLAFVASACTGIGLHVAGHGTDHDVWHNWAVAHVLTSILWTVSAGFHVRRHRHWYRAFLTKGIGGRKLITLFLSLTFLITVVTGIILLACVDGANSAVGLWHYKLGILLSVIALLHAVRRR